VIDTLCFTREVSTSPAKETDVFKKKPKTSVGLDIGNYSSKLVQLEHGPDGYTLLSYGVYDQPSNSIIEGQIKNREAVVSGIKNLIQRCDPRIRDVIISISGKGVITDRIQLQQRKGVKTSQLVRFEAEQRCPFDVEDVTLDYKIVRFDEQSERIDVLLVAAKNDLLYDLLSVVYEAELKPIVVDVDAFALYNAWEVNYRQQKEEQEEGEGAQSENLALVNIGAETTNVVFIHQGSYHSTRDLSVAGNSFVKTAQRQMGVDPKLIHQALRGKMDSKVDHNTFMFAVNKSSELLSKELDLAFSYFQSDAKVEKIDRILLSGGCALIPWLPGFLEKRHHLPVEKFDPVKTLHYSQELQQNGFKEMAPSLAVCIGLALRQAE
jgi:type IV pilus assembly protein PilM